MILAVAISACNSQVKNEERGNETGNEKAHVAKTVQLNNGNKWKADETTKKHVSSMVLLLNDSIYARESNSSRLYTALQGKVDSLVKECSMKGADHDALHTWLATVLDDLKELKEEDDQFARSYTILKKDLESFYEYFE